MANENQFLNFEGLQQYSQKLEETYLKQEDMPLKEGDAVNSAELGADNATLRKGYYIYGIDFTQKIIVLATNEQQMIPYEWHDDYIGENYDEDFVFSSPDNPSGYTFSIVNGRKWENCGTIESVNGNLINYIGDLPFTTIEVEYDEDDQALPLEKDDYSISFIFTNNTINGEFITPQIGNVELKEGMMAIGSSNNVLGNDAFVVGRRNVGYGDYSITGGHDNKTGYAGLTIGKSNYNNGRQSLMLGKENCAPGDQSSILVGGVNNTVTGNANITTGQVNTVDSDKSLVGGYMNETGADSNITSGKHNDNFSDDTIVVGNTNVSGEKGKSLGFRSIVGGHNNTNKGNNSLVVGYDNDNTGGQNIIAGQYWNVTGSHNLVAGDSRSNSVEQTISGSYNIVGGLGNSTNNNTNIIGGESNKVYADRSVVGGAWNEVAMRGGLVAGVSNIIGSTDIDKNTWFAGVIAGQSNRVTGLKTITSGYNNQAKADSALTIGSNLINSSPNSITCGAYNTELSNTLFNVGNGSSSERKSAFAIYPDQVKVGKDTNVIIDYDIAKSDVVGDNLFIVGKGTSSTDSDPGANLIIFGNSTSCDRGTNSIVLGNNNNLWESTRGIIIGCNNSAQYCYAGAETNYSMLIGNNLVFNINADDGDTPVYPQLVLGRYNQPNSNALTIVGNGLNQNNRSNAIEILADGTINLLGVNVSQNKLNKLLQIVSATGSCSIGGVGNVSFETWMTWNDWVGSSYDTSYGDVGNYIDDYVCYQNAPLRINGVYAKMTDLIINGGAYV